MLETSPRKYKSPSIVSNQAGAKSLLAIFGDREEGDDEFFKTSVRIINPQTVTAVLLVALVGKVLHVDGEIPFFSNMPH